MRIRRFSVAAACAAPLLALAVAGGTIPAAAGGPETDSAVLSYSPALGWTCTSFTSSNGDSGNCTLTTMSIGVSCLGIPPVQRAGAIDLTEPSGEAVSLSLEVTGVDSSATFTGGGTDGGAGVTASGGGGLACHGPSATGGTVTVSWTAR